MKLNEIIAQRLKTARIMKGVSMDDLCNLMGKSLSKQTISNYEKGKTVPNSQNLILLARALDVKPDYFLRTFNVTLKKIEFSDKTLLPTKESNSIIEKIRDKIEKYIEIESLIGMDHAFQGLNLSKVHNGEDILSRVSEVKKEWKLGIAPISNVTNLLEEKGIIVLEIATSERFEGMSGFANTNIPFIALNKNMSSERKRFIALHELAHILLKFDENINNKEMEVLCDLFALEMLISSFELRKLLGEARYDISLRELRNIQTTYGIEVKQIMKRASQLSIISESRYKYFNAATNKDNSMKFQIEESSFKNEGNRRFESMVYRALASDLITFSKAGELLNAPVSVVRQQLELV